MCGIIGYTGTEPVAEILANGLERLEYRGYDSSGIAYNTHNQLAYQKSEGKGERHKGTPAPSKTRDEESWKGNTYGTKQQITCKKKVCINTEIW